jgi:factor associated with neutral sphingomyelinase activation
MPSRIEGKLHLCSRSIFFEPKNIAKPLLRVKFSCGVLLRMMKNIETRKLQRLVTIRRTDAEFKVQPNQYRP